MKILFFLLALLVALPARAAFFPPTQSTALTSLGNTQGTALTLTANYNVVTTVAPGTGVILPPRSILASTIAYIVNQGLNPLAVYPTSGAAIDGLAANAPIFVAPGSTVGLSTISTNVYITIP